MTDSRPTIYVVDDDHSVRESTELLLKSVGFNVRTFGSARDLLEADIRRDNGCLVLDVRMPGMSGLDLQEELASKHPPLPVIFVTGHGTVPMSVRAMKAGAVDFLQKPFEEQDLLDAINRAIDRQREAISKEEQAEKLRRRLEALTPREYEVFFLLAAGMANKEIATELGVSERTVKAHRARIMDKMNAGSLADLVRFAERLKTLSSDQ
ncbi:MAG: response regulator transcription factor [Candidatus Latescibacterota bacterium]|jgi:RNA polymerase sigma factor (sigma-70 family)